MQIPTVKIVDPSKPDDYVIINEADFDPAVHRRWGEQESQPEALGKDETAPDAPAARRGRPRKSA
ncbi:MAG TPA: hypothetical protein VF188_00440 [Longimicrobiales bacterium]